MGSILFSLLIIILILFSLLSEWIKKKPSKKYPGKETPTVPPEEKISPKLKIPKKEELLPAKGKSGSPPAEIMELLPSGWEINAEKLREGVILAEILSPPRARRRWRFPNLP